MKEKLMSWQLILISCALLWLLGSFEQISNFFISYRNEFVTLMIKAIILLGLYYFYYLKKHDSDDTIIFIFWTAFFIRALYVLVAPYDISSHDLGYFKNLETSEYGYGHLGYIEYLYNYRHLPTFDPRELWSFYNPPLFHILGAIIVGITHSFGTKAEICFESVQILNLFAVTITVATMFKILEHYIRNKKVLTYIFATVCIHPFFYIYSATLTNDALCLMFITLSIWLCIKWESEPRIKTIVLLALCIGFAMASKLNAALVAFGIGYIFIYKFWKNRDKWKIYVLQFALFLLICAPIGLFHPVYNYIEYKMPIGYIQKVSNYSDIHIDENTYYRIGLTDIKQLLYPFQKFDPDIEKNIWGQLIKTSLFDEIQQNTTNSNLETFGTIFLWLAIILALIGIIIFFITLITPMYLDSKWRIFFALEYFVFIITYIKFCFDEPFICTMNYRYVSILLLFPFLSEGLVWSKLQDNSTRQIKCLSNIVLSALQVSFIIFSIIFELALITSLS